MSVFKICLCFSFLTVLSVSSVAAENLSAVAERIVTAKDKKAELEKDSVKIGEKIEDIGDLSIDDFLELEALPEGMDAVSAQTLYGADQGFNFMTTEQALKSIAVMRKQGIVLPEELEKNIKKDPQNASKLMNEAFASIPPAQIEGKDDIANQRRAVIKDAEANLGISFKDVLDNQKQMMGATPPAKKKRRGGK